MMMRSRGLAIMDLFLVLVLISLLYIFVSRMTYMGEVNQVIAKTDVQGNLPKSAKLPLLDEAVPADAPDVAARMQQDQVQRELAHVGEEEGKMRAIEMMNEEIEPQVDEQAKKKDIIAQDEKVRQEIDERLKRIPDMRAGPCKSMNHDGQIPASIIIDFFDYQLYDLKVTIGSVLRSTPDSLIREIIIVDDGSTLQYLIKEAQVYVTGIKKAVLVRHEMRQGRLGARMRGAREADGHNLIFLDTSAIVSQGWIEPLLEHVQLNEKAIAVPHFDKVTDPVTYEYEAVSEQLVACFSWALSVRMQKPPTTLKDDITPFSSPMIHGSVFAVTKNYWNELKGYDEGLFDSGGENVELSLRTWFCGGTIKVVPCSRVGVLNVYDPVKMNSFPNIYRITEVFLRLYKDLIKSYFSQDFEESVPADKKKMANHRMNEMAKLKCPHDINWFVQNVATEVFAPSKDATSFGFLKVRTKMCARIGNDSAVDLGSCKPRDHKLLPAQMTFELMQSGELKNNGRCLQCMDNAYVKAVSCKGGNVEPKQIWEYKNGMIINNWSKYCLMHVTDPDPKKKDIHRQIAMAQPCESDKTKDFSSWEFIKS